jgi:hypothetical protein
MAKWTARQGPSRREALGLIAAVAASPLLLQRASGAQSAGSTLVGDGLTNDLPELEKLLAGAEARGEGIVKLPAGRFLLNPGSRSTAITMPAKVRLEGAGRDLTTLVMAPGVQGHVINAPYGWIQVADLTIDGNAANRPGRVGHNLRFEGEQILIERVRVANSVSYGIAVGQRRYAKNVTIRDVEIINAGNDGLDVKNQLNQTAGISINNVVVRGFGKPDPALPKAQIGTRFDKSRGKAGIDLRGTCEVRGLEVVGLVRGRTGLRFRHGEVGGQNGPGAHGSKASNIVVRGDGEGQAIMISARDVKLDGVDITNTATMLHIIAGGASITRGTLRSASQAALVVRKADNSRIPSLELRSISFNRPKRFVLDGLDSASFVDCDFNDCDAALGSELLVDPRLTVTNCRFDRSCKT